MREVANETKSQKPPFVRKGIVKVDRQATCLQKNRNMDQFEGSRLVGQRIFTHSNSDFLPWI
jgi:hypothetical protein